MTFVVLPTPTLTTARLVLRPFRDDDRNAVYLLHASAPVMQYWDSSPWTEMAQADRFLARCRALAEEASGARVAVDRREDAAFLGWIGLQRWDPVSRKANLGYVLAEDAWGHGYATEAGQALLDWAFPAMNLNRVSAQADTRNRASGRVLEKLGFTLEGTLRENVIVDGEVSHDWTFGLLRREWEAARASR
ncbi:acetyltransferase [Arsenicicoccus piscis]|uniref:Acetyltransferase n=2 Tax=Arsenicicoccus piscis TaxID=673954 RepID=A0ABQ6HUL0_9MICO|nr:acetyltransferase [Arsenicicoccus piscis]